jgi:ring-1,2-phenylacetyl-CoA epoxidase subunit PaaA
MTAPADLRSGQLPPPRLSAASAEATDAWSPPNGLIEVGDEAPEEYFKELRKMIVFQTLAEVAGTTLFSEWVAKAPTYLRKQIMTAKVQDEIGHGQICMRVVEDLGLDRSEVIEGFLSGRFKLLNVFHYEMESWPEFGVASLLSNSSAIVQFRSLMTGSYGPYVRTLKKIMGEESFHYQQARDLMTVFAVEDREHWIEGVNVAMRKWFPLMLAYFGPAQEDPERVAKLKRWGIKPQSNEELRQEWLSKIVPVLRQLDVEIPDPAVVQDAAGVWSYTEPDWAEVQRVINGGGPASERRVALVRAAWERHRWIRSALAA